jgi:hypothetical protein
LVSSIKTVGRYIFFEVLGSPRKLRLRGATLRGSLSLGCCAAYAPAVRQRLASSGCIRSPHRYASLLQKPCGYIFGKYKQYLSYYNSEITKIDEKSAFFFAKISFSLLFSTNHKKK